MTIVHHHTEHFSFKMGSGKLFLPELAWKINPDLNLQ
jgi:hypothetical protein